MSSAVRNYNCSYKLWAVFKHNPPTLNDIISFQDEVVAESRFDQNYHSCIVLNFQPISLEADYREDKDNG